MKIAGHLVITVSLRCPWGKKTLTFSLNSTSLIQTLSMTPSVSINPSSPNSDQDQFSPDNIHTLSRDML